MEPVVHFIFKEGEVIQVIGLEGGSAQVLGQEGGVAQVLGQDPPGEDLVIDQDIDQSSFNVQVAMEVQSLMDCWCAMISFKCAK